MSTYNNQRRRKKPYKVKIRYDRVIGALAILIVLIILLVSCVKSCGSDDSSDDESSIVPTESKSDSVEKEKEESADSKAAALDNYSTVTVIPGAVYEGNLILVNKDHSYSFPATAEENIVPVYENCTDSYQYADLEVSLTKDTITALNALMDKFYETKKINDCIVISGFRTKEYQDQIYELGTTDITGGCSDYHTGLSFDLGIYPADEEQSSYFYVPNDDYSWVNENCAKYGFILRDPEGKEDKTGVEAKSYTFRYVGIPHAICMSENNLCLEEYIDFVKNYTYDGDHLTVAGPEKNYEVYYVPAKPGADTDVPIPSDKTYTISGNNIDGFIVTVELS